METGDISGRKVFQVAVLNIRKFTVTCSVSFTETGNRYRKLLTTNIERQLVTDLNIETLSAFNSTDTCGSASPHQDPATISLGGAYRAGHRQFPAKTFLALLLLRLTIFFSDFCQQSFTVVVGDRPGTMCIGG